MRVNTVKIPIDFGLHWHWPSISFLILKPIFVPIWDKMLFASFFVVYTLVRPLLSSHSPYILVVWVTWKLKAWSGLTNLSTNRHDLPWKKSMQPDLIGWGWRMLICGKKHHNFCIIPYSYHTISYHCVPQTLSFTKCKVYCFPRILSFTKWEVCCVPQILSFSKWEVYCALYKENQVI